MKIQETSKKWVAMLKGSVLPLILGAAIFTLFWFVYKKYGVRYRAYIDKSFLVFLVLFITYWISKISSSLFGWYALNVAAKTKTNLDDQFIPFFRRASATIIWGIGLVMVLGQLGVNISALIATLGVSSIAIALAAQDTIANIIAGFLIMIDRPFAVGDTIKLPSGEKVKAIDIGIRRSKFKSEDNAVIIVPNVDLSKNKIVNYTHNG